MAEQVAVVGIAGQAPGASPTGEARLRVPDPGVRLPAVAVPTVAVWFGSLALFVAATWFGLTSSSPWRLAVVIPVNTVVTFLMFTVLHESTHHAAGRLAWVNEVFGRLSMPFVSAWGTFPFLKFVHIEHHRNTNENQLVDPDAWTETGPSWQLPLRWLVTDVWYFVFYLRRAPRRPRGEVAGLAVNVTAATALTVVCVQAGYGWDLLVLFLLPQRLGIGVLAWAFDWLPHHDLGVTNRVNRFLATRMRVGWEGVMFPVMMYQNYHLVHHIHPTIPFYKYGEAWRRTEGDYLQRKVPISTLWGRALSPEEYREWRGITEHFDDDTASTAASGARFHRLLIAEVDRLTPDAVAITFYVPEGLRETFRFRPGQHVTVRATVGGEELRRSYSICSPAPSGALRIAVKAVDGGAFSTFANTMVAPGLELDVMPPTGGFTLAPARSDGRHIVAVAAGSGITPLMSIVATALTDEPSANATLVYANRSRAHTMFADEIATLVRRFDGRLRVLHALSREDASGADGFEAFTAGRLDDARIAGLLDGGLGVDAATVDGWYLCGPQDLADAVSSALLARGVAPDAVHRESFASGRAGGFSADVDVVAATVEVTVGGLTRTITTEGDESLLESALRHGLDVPYSCTGGACGTCRATLCGGTVHMEQNYSLSDADVASGAVLTCQSRPTSETLRVDYDR